MLRYSRYLIDNELSIPRDASATEFYELNAIFENDCHFQTGTSLALCQSTPKFRAKRHQSYSPRPFTENSPLIAEIQNVNVSFSLK
jgi:hypothetical protein